MLLQAQFESLRYMQQLPFLAIATASVLFVTLVAIFYPRRQGKGLSVPFYEWNTAVAGNPRTRWMSDSLRLLREGYKKVRKRFQNARSRSYISS